MAKNANLENVELTFRGRKLRVPVWVQPGQAENSVTLPLGYGQHVSGRTGQYVEFNAYALRTCDGLRVRRRSDDAESRRSSLVVTTHNHHEVEGRGILHDGTLAQFLNDPHDAQKAEQLPPNDYTLYHPSEYPYKGYKWGMVVDLNVWIGCHACTVACQAENNIHVVGKQQVGMHREMHWIRVSTFYSGKEKNPTITHQPGRCMDCENAPCELVCPVGATVYDKEELNLQIYNRCVDTRYCSNNCPYKIRRLNFLEHNSGLNSSVKLVKNADVTVRSGGVMEKCTYCLQRINSARIAAGLQERKIRDGEIIPAGAQVCPAEAITLGDMNDLKSQVMRLMRSPLNYLMLAELNTQLRTTYLANLRNLNAELV